MIEEALSFLWGEFSYRTWNLLYIGLIFVLIERLWPSEKGQPQWSAHKRTDLLYAYLLPLLTFPLYTIAARGLLGIMGSLGLTAEWPGAEQPALWFLRTLQSFVIAQPWYLQLLLVLFVGDFVGYWRHRMMHLKYLWPFHAIHHSSQQLDWLSNNRLHPINAIVIETCAVTTLVLCGFTSEVVAGHMVIRGIYSTFLHANIPLSYGVLNYVFVSPLMHRWHHSSDPRVIDKNLSIIFSFLDIAFGTYCIPKRERPNSIGIPATEVPAGFLGQLMYPLYKLAPAGFRTFAGIRLLPRRRLEGAGRAAVVAHAVPDEVGPSALLQAPPERQDWGGGA